MPLGHIAYLLLLICTSDPFLRAGCSLFSSLTSAPNYWTIPSAPNAAFLLAFNLYQTECEQSQVSNRLWEESRELEQFWVNIGDAHWHLTFVTRGSQGNRDTTGFSMNSCTYSLGLKETKSVLLLSDKGCPLGPLYSFFLVLSPFL